MGLLWRQSVTFRDSGGLGIGVNTSMFGVLRTTLLQPMPVIEPDRLVVLSHGANARFSYPRYRDYQERSRTLQSLTAACPMESDLDVDGESQFVASEAVSANYAEVVGVRLILGRWFASDHEPSAGRSNPSRRRTLSSASHRRSSPASSRRCARICGCPSGRVRG